ncbi:acyl-CoA-binding protein [Vibrio hangzhouensis]|uniref:acyl-CoA-binding protein n=1 Tax=Vibrio hangzhouensis TaxID=462991 RepID=UPI001C9412E7|nr:acyl-CoA-binding protein [Vibrio hangzhouensis]MBY6195887.1 acyl-CoA-binding protein [Vibrio hangzhouensis]
MSDLSSQFEAAAEAVKTLKQRPDDETLLSLYAYYKQGSTGDVQGKRPGLFDFKGGAKYAAWERLRGMESDKAKQAYIDLVERLASA